MRQRSSVSICSSPPIVDLAVVATAVARMGLTAHRDTDEHPLQAAFQMRDGKPMRDVLDWQRGW